MWGSGLVDAVLDIFGSGPKAVVEAEAVEILRWVRVIGLKGPVS